MSKWIKVEDRDDVIATVAQMDLSSKADEDAEMMKMMVRLPEYDAIPLSEIETVRKAWEIEGPSPQYHHAQKEHLRTHWPTLYKALNGLLEELRKVGK